MNARVTTMLVFVFLLAVGVSLGGTLLIIESRQNGQTSAEVETLRADVDRLKSDFLMQSERLAFLEEIGDRTPELPPEPKRKSALANEPAGKADAMARLPKDDDLRSTIEDISRKQAKVALKEEREAEEKEQAERRVERRKEMAERMEKRLNDTYDEHLKTLVKELDLNAYQEGDIKAALDERKEGITKFYAQRHTRDNEQQDGERISWEDINKKYEEQLNQVLTASQLEIYKEKELGNAFTRGWGGMMGRGRNRGSGRSGRSGRTGGGR